MKDRLGITIFSLDAWYFDDAICREKLLEHFKVSSFAGLGLADYDCGIISAARAPSVPARDTENNSLSNLTHITPYSGRKIHDAGQCHKAEPGAVRDPSARKQKRGSLLWVLDKTRTAMGCENTP